MFDPEKRKEVAEMEAFRRARKAKYMRRKDAEKLLAKMNSLIDEKGKIVDLKESQCLFNTLTRSGWTLVRGFKAGSRKVFRWASSLTLDQLDYVLESSRYFTRFNRFQVNIAREEWRIRIRTGR